MISQYKGPYTKKKHSLGCLSLLYASQISLWVPVDAIASQSFQGGLAGFVEPSIRGDVVNICTMTIIS